jgi:hypothetical protein
MEDCLWNAGYTPGERNPVDGLEYTCEPGEGTRICNYGSRALILGLPVPESCPQKDEVHELIRPVEDEKEKDDIETLDEYIRRMAEEARARLGLGRADVEE